MSEWVGGQDETTAAAQCSGWVDTTGAVQWMGGWIDRAARVVDRIQHPTPTVIGMQRPIRSIVRSIVLSHSPPLRFTYMYSGAALPGTGAGPGLARLRRPRAAAGRHVLMSGERGGLINSEAAGRHGLLGERVGGWGKKAEMYMYMMACYNKKIKQTRKQSKAKQSKAKQ